MIGVACERSRPRISLAVSKPSMPGMRTSSRITAKSCLSASLSASSPDCAASSVWPSEASSSCSANRLFGSSSKILIVDDEPKSLFALQELLASLGQTLLAAQSGEEALKLALKHDFAVILLDVRMPGMDGFETAKLIRGRERSQATPIIFLTAQADEMTSMFKGYAVGAVD